MASALVRIKTAVDSNGLAQANSDADKLMKSFKKLATAGWIGAAVAVAKKVSQALGDCKKAYLEAEGATSKYAKASEEMSKATDRLKKAIGGSLISGNNGNALMSLSSAINRVASSIEKTNAQNRLKEELQSSTYGSNKSVGELWNDYITAETIRINAQRKLDTAKTSGELLADDDFKKMQTAIDEATKAAEKVWKLYEKARDGQPVATTGQRAVTKSASTKEEWLSQLIGTGDASSILSFANGINSQKTQKESYELLLKSARSSEDAVKYLQATSSEFNSMLSMRKYYNGLIEGGGEAGKAAKELRKPLQDAINEMIKSLLDSLPEKIAEKTGAEVGHELFMSWYENWEKEQAEYKKKEEEKIKLLEEQKDSVKQSALGGLGQFGTLLQGDWWGLLADFAGQLVARFNELSPEMDIITNFVTVLVSALDPVLIAISKVLPFVVEFLKSVYGFIYTIASFIRAIFNTLVYGIKWIVSAITFDKNGRKNAEQVINESWQAMSEANIQAAIDKAFSTSYGGSSGSSSGSKSASYTAARDLYVTINYEHSYINGDAREIAINLRNEIRTAEAMGF